MLIRNKVVSLPPRDKPSRPTMTDAVSEILDKPLAPATRSIREALSMLFVHIQPESDSQEEWPLVIAGSTARKLCADPDLQPSDLDLKLPVSLPDPPEGTDKEAYLRNSLVRRVNTHLKTAYPDLKRGDGLLLISQGNYSYQFRLGDMDLRMEVAFPSDKKDKKNAPSWDAADNSFRVKIATIRADGLRWLETPEPSSDTGSMDFAQHCTEARLHYSEGIEHGGFFRHLLSLRRPYAQSLVLDHVPAQVDAFVQELTQSGNGAGMNSTKEDPLMKLIHTLNRILFEMAEKKTPPETYKTILQTVFLAIYQNKEKLESPGGDDVQCPYRNVLSVLRFFRRASLDLSKRPATAIDRLVRKYVLEMRDLKSAARMRAIPNFIDTVINQEAAPVEEQFLRDVQKTGGEPSVSLDSALRLFSDETLGMVQQLAKMESPLDIPRQQVIWDSYSSRVARLEKQFGLSLPGLPKTMTLSERVITTFFGVLAGVHDLADQMNGPKSCFEHMIATGRTMLSGIQTKAPLEALHQPRLTPELATGLVGALSPKEKKGGLGFALSVLSKHKLYQELATQPLHNFKIPAMPILSKTVKISAPSAAMERQPTVEENKKDEPEKAGRVRRKKRRPKKGKSDDCPWD